MKNENTSGIKSLDSKELDVVIKYGDIFIRRKIIVNVI